jgi:uncharacterized protein YuzE
MAVRLSYDREADAIYITLRELPYAYGEDIDHERRVDYSAYGEPIGVELLCVSDGVNVDDLPDQATIVRLLEEHRIMVFA